jgi:diguanylate cyclase (GGDEF)-like protein/PAS domain S-box-containing protein
VSSVAEFEAVASAVFAQTEAMLLLVDEEQRVVAINTAASAAAGIAIDDAAGTEAIRFVATRHAPEFRRALREAARGGSVTQESALPDGTGDPRSVAWSISRVGVEPCRVACVGIDVTASRDERESLRTQAMTDQLTGLPNRAALLEHLGSMVGSGASVLFCDLDGFKRVNDTLGHAAGDVVLVQAARRLRRAIRGEDYVARIGGDEFVIVVPPDANSSFEGLARRLLRAIEQPMVLPGGVAATVGMSIGHAELLAGVEPDGVLRAADEEMYKMKSRLPTRTTADAD